MPRFLAVAMTLTVITWFTQADPAAAGNPPAVRFRLDHHGAVIIPVLLNGEGPFTFLLDTGSNASAISAEAASRIRAPIVAKAEFITPAGRGFRLIGQIDHLSVGAIMADAIKATILPDAELSKTTAIPGLDGILGQDVLLSHTYTLDYRHKTIEWDALAEDTDDMKLPLASREGRVLVELQQHDGTVIRLVPDSGSDGLVLFIRNGGAPLTLDGRPGRQQLAALNGSNAVTPVVVRQLILGHLTLRDQPAVTVARDEADAPDGDGLLPLHHFSSVTFDASGYIVFRR